MTAFGVIAEFDPFHSGHKYLLEQASALTKADVCVSVMSGNFVQRGRPAVYDKWKRSSQAVENGVDLVVEMPQAYAISSAGYFAKAGVHILNNLGVKYILFGSETGDIEYLREIARKTIVIEDNHSGLIKEYLGKGLSYPRAIQMAFDSIYPELSKDEKPGSNDILAIEYLKVIERLGLDIVPIAVTRKGETHHESSSAIRENILRDPEEGPRLRNIYRNYYNLAKYSALLKSGEEIDSYDSSREGIGNSLLSNLRKSKDLEYWIVSSKSKRYTYTRLSRLLASIVLDSKPELLSISPDYITPLAMSQAGSSYLKQIKKDRDIVVIDDIPKYLKYGDENLVKLLNLDIRAQDVYNLLSDEDMYINSDYVKKPLVLK